MSRAFNLTQAIQAVGGNPALVDGIYTGKRNRPYIVPLESWKPGWILRLTYSSLANLEIELMHDPDGASAECRLWLGYNVNLQYLGLANPKPNPIPFTWSNTLEAFIRAAGQKHGQNTEEMQIVQCLLDHMSTEALCVQ